MIQLLTKEEVKEHEKELIKFCKENHCLMYNYMLTIEGIRNEAKNNYHIGVDLAKDKNSEKAPKLSWAETIAKAGRKD